MIKDKGEEMKKIRVILVTDGDRVAQKVMEQMASEIGLRCISASAGNPTPIYGSEIVRLLKEVEYDPVLVMFDDKGDVEKGYGESALQYVATHPDIIVLGAIAVASNSMDLGGAHVDICITQDGKLTRKSVNKCGRILEYGINLENEPMIRGDTVDVLDELNLPIIVGIGDIGKMHQKDDLYLGSPITKLAIEEILKYHGLYRK